VVILLIALATGAYFVLRGPDRNRAQGETAAAAAAPVVPAPEQPSNPTQPNASTDTRQASEDKKKAAEERRKAESDAAAIEAQKKAGEAKAQDKTEKAYSVPPPQATVSVPQPTIPATPPPANLTPARDACVLVSVVDADGLAVPRVRVEVVDQSDSAASTLFNGRTGPQGRCQACGLVSGHSVRVAVLGPMGGVLGSQIIVARAGKNFVQIPLQRRMDEATPRMYGPNRKRGFQRP
jgi:hypothetical protein